ncbi:response regulator transcription factor [Kitasatospora sp. NPDC002227]|uniref:response regulator transcription factor n=1 Tax=Kitasatospora sp. NPDC002227 TaxID=3154773 RepID=UPI00332BDCCE
MITVVLADDQRIIADALGQLLAQEKDIDVLAVVGDGDQALAAIRQHRPTVALLDIDMPGQDGLAVTVQVKQELPQCRVVILTSFGQPGYLTRALNAQADGFVAKNSQVEEIIETVRQVAAGRRVIDPALAVTALTAAPNPLTGREREVLEAAEHGAPLSDVASRLHLAHGTIRNHLSAAMTKTGTRTRVEAAKAARERGWL